HRIGEGESCPARLRIQPPWILQTTGRAVPSPVGRERVRVRVFLLELRLLLGTYSCANPKSKPGPEGKRKRGSTANVQTPATAILAAIVQRGRTRRAEGVKK